LARRLDWYVQKLKKMAGNQHKTAKLNRSSKNGDSSWLFLHKRREILSSKRVAMPITGMAVKEGRFTEAEEFFQGFKRGKEI